jgi:ABC-type antimicrobial peptide transport system ATPase subunit
MLVVFVLVLKVNQSDNLYQATNVMYTRANTTNISPYTYTLYMTLTLVAWYRLSDWFTFRTRTNTTNISPYVQCICIGRDVGGVCPCSKGEPVRQPVPSHERHVQYICIGRDVGGVCPCSKGYCPENLSLFS